MDPMHALASLDRVAARAAGTPGADAPLALAPRVPTLFEPPIGAPAPDLPEQQADVERPPDWPARRAAFEPAQDRGNPAADRPTGTVAERSVSRRRDEEAARPVDPVAAGPVTRGLAQVAPDAARAGDLEGHRPGVAPLPAPPSAATSAQPAPASDLARLAREAVSRVLLEREDRERATRRSPALLPPRGAAQPSTPATRRAAPAPEPVRPIARADARRAPTAPPPAPPVVHVTIGRVDIRAASAPQTVARQPVRSGERAPASLDSYLRRRAHGSRS